MVRRSGRYIGSALSVLVARVEIGLSLLPIRAVELLDREFHRLIQAVGVHAPGAGMRARLIEALHAAIAAEEVLGSPCTEAVAGQRIAAGHPLEALMQHHHVQEARHPAHGAIAVERGHWRRGHLLLEPHRPAMATARNAHSVGIMRFGALVEVIVMNQRRLSPERHGLAIAESPFAAVAILGADIAVD